MGESEVRLRSPWVVAWWGLAVPWFAIAWVMVPVRSDGAWVTVDGSPADLFGTVIAVMCLACGSFFCIFAPTPVRVGGGFLQYRWGFKRERIDLRAVTAVDVIPRPGTVFDAVQPVLRFDEREEEPLSGLAGYPGGGGRNRRVDRHVDVLRRACEDAQGSSDLGQTPEPAGG